MFSISTAPERVELAVAIVLSALIATSSAYGQHPPVTHRAVLSAVLIPSAYGAPGYFDHRAAVVLSAVFIPSAYGAPLYFDHRTAVVIAAVLAPAAAYPPYLTFKHEVFAGDDVLMSCVDNSPTTKQLNLHRKYRNGTPPDYGYYFDEFMASWRMTTELVYEVPPWNSNGRLVIHKRPGRFELTLLNVQCEDATLYRCNADRMPLDYYRTVTEDAQNLRVKLPDGTVCTSNDFTSWVKTKPILIMPLEYHTHYGTENEVTIQCDRYHTLFPYDNWVYHLEIKVVDWDKVKEGYHHESSEAQHRVLYWQFNGPLNGKPATRIGSKFTGRTRVNRYKNPIDPLRLGVPPTNYTLTLMAIIKNVTCVDSTWYYCDTGHVELRDRQHMQVYDNKGNKCPEYDEEAAACSKCKINPKRSGGVQHMTSFATRLLCVLYVVVCSLFGAFR